MSSQALKKIAKTVLKDLERTQHKVGDKVQSTSARKKLAENIGQILVVNKKVFLNTLILYAPELTKDERKEVWDRFNTYLNTLARKVPSKELKTVKEAMKKLKLSPFEHAYAIKTYASADRAKKKVLLEIIIKTLNTSNTSYNETRLNQIGGSDNKEGVQLGHADKGVGYAASSIRALRVKQIAESGFSVMNTSEKAKVSSIFTKYEETLDLTLDHSQVISGNRALKKDYVAVLSWQTTKENQELAQIERMALSAVRNSFNNIANLESSTTLNDSIPQVILGNLAPTKAKNVTVKGKKVKEIKEKTSGSSRKKIKSQKSVKVVKDPSSFKKSKKIQEKAKTSSSPFRFVALFNKQLPGTVAKNMGSPALNLRTGRFAASTRVVNARVTPQGFTSFDYTYMKYPYQTFEPGYAQGSVDRDPRKLIERSMREIATEFALGRFYTRRV